MKQRRDLVLAAALVAACAACRPAEPPVGALHVEPREVDLGYPQVAKLRLVWQPRTPLPEASGGPLVFVHLLEEPGVVARTFDHPFPAAWEPGDSLGYDVAIYQSALGPPLDPGSYLLSVGLYDSQSGARWALEAEGEDVDRKEYAVATVEVPDASQAPMFSFSTTWAPIEGGADQQILGRRWLTAAGEIQVREIAKPGSVWMVLRIPQPRPDAQSLDLEAGAAQPLVLVSQGCGGAEVSISGAGVHEIELPMGDRPGEEPPTTCEIRVRPNFRLLEKATMQAVTVSLENLAWAPVPSAP